MITLTPQVLRDLQKIVEDYTGVVAMVMFGEDMVSPESLELAESMGLIDKDNPHSLAALLHLYGAYTAAMGPKRSPKTLAEFRKIVREKRIPQTEPERRASEAARVMGATAMRDSALRLSSEVVTAAVIGDQNLYSSMREMVRDAVAAKYGDQQAQERVKQHGRMVLGDHKARVLDGMVRQTIRSTASDIGHATGEWRRDLQRIAQTETTKAYQKGQQARWEAEEDETAAATGKPPRPTLVYKIPRPGACPHCIRLHLDGDVPRIYDMAVIVANTNIKKKAKDWQFVTGPVHPWCGCPLMKVPSFVTMPDSWRSGEAAPSVIGPGGRLVLP